MSSFMENVQPAVKKETKRVAISTVVGVILMWVVIGVLHLVMPGKVPFDYTVILGGIGGGARNALAEAGIQLFPGAGGNADAQVESFLAGCLNYNPNTVCSHHAHGNGEHNCGGHGEGHSCGSSHNCEH